MNEKNPPGQLYLGIDGGGSKCKARLVDAAGNLLGEGVAGPANAFQNRDQACQSMVESARRALGAARLPGAALNSLVVGAGLAGVNIPRIADEMAAWRHPFLRLHLATDIHIACLAAHGGQDGAVIVVGTGSVGYSFHGGTGTSYGGHGFPFGDKGSGAWLGLEALKAVLLALDGLGPQTSLSQRVESQLGESGLGVVDVMAAAAPRQYGTLAPLVLDCAGQGDPVANGILADAGDYLSDMAEELLPDPDAVLCMLGGLGEKLRPWMRAEVVARIVTARGQPEEGAVRFALQA